VRVLVTGAGGLVGSALVPALEAAGHDVVRLVRGAPRSPAEFAWDPARGTLDRRALEGTGAAVHLAGESIAGGRWTPQRRAAIRDSRVLSTVLLARALAEHHGSAATLVCASAVGFYGDRGDEILTEESAQGDGFLAGVVRDWEAAAEPARQAGARVVHLRFGMVLAREGGALVPLVRLSRFGLGGPLGGGRQWMSWIAREDLIAVIRAALEDHRLRGAVNAVAPAPVPQREFARALGRVLGRPSWLPTPGIAPRLLLGEMALQLLIFSQRVVPARLLAAGHSFRHPELEGALGTILGRVS
jgi:uncharacterized protein (TIGR01777 family)